MKKNTHEDTKEVAMESTTDILHLKGSLQHRALKNKSPQEIIDIEHAVVKAHSPAYRAKLLHF